MLVKILRSCTHAGMDLFRERLALGLVVEDTDSLVMEKVLTPDGDVHDVRVRIWSVEDDPFPLMDTLRTASC